jgi:hypothetical protein
MINTCGDSEAFHRRMLEERINKRHDTICCRRAIVNVCPKFIRPDIDLKSKSMSRVKVFDPYRVTGFEQKHKGLAKSSYHVRQIPVEESICKVRANAATSFSAVRCPVFVYSRSQSNTVNAVWSTITYLAKCDPVFPWLPMRRTL